MRIILPILFFVSFHNKYCQDTTTFFQKVENVIPSGNISLGYEYGFLPFLVNVNPPQGNFKTEGSIQLELLDLPFNTSFHYSSLGTISGLNNHFTVNFDAQKYLQQKKESLFEEKMKRIGEIDSLAILKQSLKTKLDYLYLVKDGKINLPNADVPNFDTLDLNIPNFHDSLSLPSISDSSKIPNVKNPIDSILGSTDIPNLNNPMDSISSLIENYQKTVSDIDQTITGLKSLNEISIDSLAKNPISSKSNFKGKLTSFFSGIKKCNIGLTYPDYSQFLISRTPVRGINLEYSKNNIYVAFTHGKTVNNIFLSNNVLQNTLNAGRNLYNFFDFNGVADGRRITAMKLGYGKKESSHIFIGALYGLGKVSYQDSNIVYDTEKNLVGEVDLKWKAKKYHTVDFLIGRSALQVNEVNLEENDKLLNRFTDFNDKTYGLLTRYQLDLKSTELKLTFRVVDPFYRSFGVAFIKSDNIRYEAKLKQKIGKKLSFDLFYRRENDNILGIFNYQNVITAYGAGGSFRPTKHWLLKADYRPLILSVKDSFTPSDSTDLGSENYITNFVLSYNNRINKTYFFATAVYSYYQLTFDENLNIYQNINLSLSIQHKSIWTNDLLFNNYRTTDKTTVPLSSILENDFSFHLNKLDITLIGKVSFTQNADVNYGYGLKGSYKVSKTFSIFASSEKLVLGDFYNSILQEGLESYPYLFSAGIKISW